MRQLKITPSITNRDSHSLDQYLNDISKIGMVTPDEEVTLTRLIRGGDEAALHKLTRANLRFVVSVSKKFQNQGLPLNDLISEGNLGLIKAAYRFDETKGFKFISYAVWWIRQGILQAIAEKSRIIRLPLNQIGSISGINKTYSRLEQEFEREPSVEELAEAMEKTVDRIADVMSISRRTASLDAPFGNESENSLLDTIASGVSTTDDALLKESVSVTIKNVLSTLPERERSVLTLFFGIGYSQPYTLEEIGDHFSLTRERVRQIKDKALHNLRQQTHRYELLKSMNS
ncbi:RNA polymerase sigma factor RpoD/SigA [Mucilaginibacter rubeus]|uniref:RNA polymerase sigma factor RpoD/SigA n=1 Tax=Mucilaginibacter rubeus TaxID=2027860 RepID=A0AAE6JC99_9SPHI|nr:MULTISPECIES: RNA polymerase sigma factor RpoD/SigA [Mucilaginibacter]QEM02997.1 RNA polymerase sigma factor RpoD/SigA [Mucilaginibacter rubeus]QEM15615.1 RNA polymerase sigma factor RpoD/SigA [Mucilaginibacter gossypii]QTE41650.1 RNA polymerase sigma factor RpoD/SigA [Mucilaginibacter rubeus]QTE48255.1 RNA polymerase sigma factor RpoD/SigA [Mucilaginibacter rubeus]QTE59643.1 RNA polymerase sigma factor RpoD/SigA [Mucilaginibacter rubeus]